MDIKNHNTKRENPVTRKWLRIAVFIAVFVGIVLMVFRYFGFVSARTDTNSTCAKACAEMSGKNGY